MKYIKTFENVNLNYKVGDYAIFNYDNVDYAHNVRMTDDGVGNLRLYYLTPDSKQIVIESNIGTVNYDTGELVFDLNPWDYSGLINVYAITSYDDIVVQESKYLKIDYDKVLITVNVFRQ